MSITGAKCTHTITCAHTNVKEMCNVTSLHAHTHPITCTRWWPYFPSEIEKALARALAVCLNASWRAAAERRGGERPRGLLRVITISTKEGLEDDRGENKRRLL